MTRFALLALAFTASLATAQPKPALVQDVDGVARNTFQRDPIRNDCGGANSCQIDFDEVPAGFRLVIVQVSVAASAATGSDTLYLRLQGQLDHALAHFMLTGPSNARYATFPVTLVIGPGRSLAATVFGATLAGSVSVSVVGYLVAI